MFFHNFKYTLKTLLRNRILVFWTFLFPIILGTFFNVAFSDIESDEKLKIIDIAIVENEEYKNKDAFTNAIKELSDENSDNQLFNTKFIEEDEAKSLLEEKEITGYITFTDTSVNIHVNSNGINETILRYTVDEITSTITTINDIVSDKIESEVSSGATDINVEALYSSAVSMIDNAEVELNDTSRKNLSYTMVEFYTLIAMACLYGGMFSMYVTKFKLANMGGVGKRTSISPIEKGKMLVGSLLASYIVQLIGIFLLFIYTVFVLKVDYGNNLPLIILLALIGSLAGLSIGLLVGTVLKTNENTKIGILIGVTMFGCFLSGMMGITLKYYIDKYVPILNKINPASMITDGFYALYYYDTLNRYIFNIVSLLVFSLVLITISSLVLRRQKYDSI